MSAAKEFVRETDCLRFSFSKIITHGEKNIKNTAEFLIPIESVGQPLDQFTPRMFSLLKNAVEEE
jgi:hypothetical protein